MPRPMQRLGAQQAEAVGGHEGAFVPLRLLVAAQVDGALVEAGQVLERLLALAELHVVLEEDLQAALVLGRVVVLDVHQLLGLLEGEPAEDDTVDDAEHGRRKADAQGESQHRGQAEAGVLGQHADAVTKIARQSCHGRPSRGLTSRRRELVTSRGPFRLPVLRAGARCSRCRRRRAGWASRPRAALTCQPQRSAHLR